MSNSQLNPIEPGSIADDEFRLLDLLIVLSRYKRMILGIVLGALVLASTLSILLPDIYVARAQLLPPQKKTSGAAALLSQMGGVAAAAGISGMKTPADLHVGMLKSRAVADRLISRYDLKKVYGTESQEKTRLVFARNTTIVAAKNGLITITVEDRDKALAARLANGYIEELAKLTRQIVIREAVQRRKFFERELATSQRNLIAAELALKQGLDRDGLISVGADAEAIVETVAQLRARISAKEVELNSMRVFVTGENQSFRRAQEELASLRAELAKLENGSALANDPAAEFRSAHTQGWRNASLLREVKYYELLSELLARQYGNSRLNEADDSSLVQVLDPAVEPDESQKPRRLLMVALCGLAGLVIGISCAFVAEAQRRMVLKPKGAARWGALRTQLGSR